MIIIIIIIIIYIFSFLKSICERGHFSYVFFAIKSSEVATGGVL